MRTAVLFLSLPLVAGALAAQAYGPATPQTEPLPSIRVQVDSAARVVRITAGPFRVQGGMGDDGAMAGMMDMGAMHDQHVSFAWPVDGWVHGCRVALLDAAGKALPLALLHHTGLVNLSRRELAYPMFERLVAAGKETADLEVPASIGVALGSQEPMMLYVGLHDETGRGVDAVYVQLTLAWTPRRRSAPLAVMPFFAEVNHHVGGTSAFDVPPGRSTQTSTFTIPVSGGLLAVGGHMHDYGKSLTLEDATAGRTLVRLQARRARDGTIRGMGRFVFGYQSDALRLVAGHLYRLVAVYDNPTGKMIVNGGMASMAGAFVPDDWSKVPALDTNDSSVVADAKSLKGRE